MAWMTHAPKERPMTRRKVRSSDIASIGHDGRALEIEFHDGGIYQYLGVTPNRAAALMLAKSKGEYLAKHIIPRHKATKVSK
jgi:hypothetical protein